MTNEQIEAIRERVEKATEGPWDHYGNNAAHQIHVSHNGCAMERIVPGEFDGLPCGVLKYVDALFIAHARTDIPLLLAEVERLRGLVDTYRKGAWDVTLD